MLLKILKGILVKFLIIVVVINFYNFLMTNEFFQTINQIYIIISLLLLYILLEIIIKCDIKENFDNKEDTETPKTNTELSVNIKQLMEERPEEKQPVEEQSEEKQPVEEQSEEKQPVEEQSEEKNNKLVDNNQRKNEDLKQIQDKYVLMPIESWIDNDITLMQQKQVGESCSCPTLLDNQYMNY